jgi:hypothetical protein
MIFLLRNLEFGSTTIRPVARKVHVSAMYLLGVYKILKTAMPISPLKTCDTALYPRIASVEPSWLEITGFHKCMHRQDVLCSAIERIM